jgi:NitT/TauT family transport system substrate-binding protein
MILRKSIIAAAVAAATVAAPAFSEAAKITLAPPGVPPIFISTITFVARDAGFFKKYGADVELRQFDNGTAAGRAVVAGDLDASMSATALLISQIANANVPIVGIYGFPKPDFQLATTDTAKATCNDVKGQQVGVDTPGGARVIALKSILAGGCHMTLNDVQQVPLGSNSASAMIAGQITYAILHLDDVPDIESRGKKVAIIKTQLEASPEAHNLMIVVRKDKLAEKRDDFVRMVAGLIGAAHYMADPKNLDAVAKIAEVTGRSHDIAKGAVQGYVKFGLWAQTDDGMNPQQLANFIKIQESAGSILPGKTPPTAEQLIDASIWRDANALVEKTK